MSAVDKASGAIKGTIVVLLDTLAIVTELAKQVVTVIDDAVDSLKKKLTEE